MGNITEPRYFQAIFDFSGGSVVGDKRQTIADWLNHLMSLHAVISSVNVTVLGHGLLVLVRADPRKTDIEL